MQRKRLTIGAWAVALLFAGGSAHAQWSADGEQGWRPTRSNWERRVTQPPREYSTTNVTAPAAQVAATDDEPPIAMSRPADSVPRTSRRPPSDERPANYVRGEESPGAASYERQPSARMTGYRRTAAQEPARIASAPDMPLGPIEPIPAGTPMGDIGYEYGAGPAAVGCDGCGYDAVGCAPCVPYGDCCDLLGFGLGGYVLRHISLFAGVHGFKGPVDQGRNGNFGLHEGFNFGACVGGPFEIGYQFGFQAVHSNFSGDQAAADGIRRGDRDQYFITGGLFKRAPCGGMQWGVVYDIQHDRYYGTFELQQIRQETSFVLPNGNEIGYMGVYGLDGDTYQQSAMNAIVFDPTDMYAVFFRRHFELGGEGRAWVGLSGFGDALLGAELRMPLGRSWAIENRINYLIPKEGRGVGGQQEESWGLAIQLVWYPGRSAACEGQNCYRPLLSVADNATFMVNQRGHR